MDAVPSAWAVRKLKASWEQEAADLMTAVRIPEVPTFASVQWLVSQLQKQAGTDEGGRDNPEEEALFPWVGTLILADLL